MKFFSWIAFVVGSLLHFFGTNLLFRASIRDAHAYLHGQPEYPLILSIASWVWLPVPMLLKPLLRVQHGVLKEAHFPYMWLMIFLWSLVVGICCGFVVPRLLGWRRQIA
jgi:hypothetical protein